MTSPISLRELREREVRGFSASEFVMLRPEDRDAVVAVVEAAQAFTDNATCLDETCTHKVCVLNKALARFKDDA